MTIVLAWLLTLTAHAGNDRGQAFGNEAATTGGAMVATTSDAEAAWYNPAGLGGASRTRLDVNLSAFVLRIRPIPAFVTAELGDDDVTVDGAATQLVTVPASLAMARRISPKLVLGFGVYSTRGERVDGLASAEIEPVVPGWDTASMAVSTQLILEQQQIQAGLSLGGIVTDRLHLGGSLLGVLDTVRVTETFLGDLSGTEGGATRGRLLDHASSLSQSTLGLRGVFALQAEPVDGFHLGFVARSPVLGFYSWGRQSQTNVGADVPSSSELPERTYSETTTGEARASQVDPLRLTLALGASGARWRIGLEGELVVPISGPGGQQSWRLQGNAALGARFQVTEKIWGGVGLYTDRTLNASSGPAQAQLDYYGLTLGPEIRSPIAVKREGEPLVFVTTLGLRYAIGVGTYGGVVWSPLSDATVDQRLSSTPLDAVFHEVAVQIGSSVLF